MSELIREEAATWWVRCNEGLDEAQKVDFEAWLGKSPEHQAALERMKRTWRALDSLPLKNRAANNPQYETPKNRRAWQKGIVATMFACMLLVAGLQWRAWQEGQPSFEEHYATQRGELREVELPDGSHLVLDTASRVWVRFYKNRREVRLEEGQAAFEVSKSAKRPFRVLAGDLAVEVVGTKFGVRHLKEGVSVAVEEGRVRVGQRFSEDEYRFFEELSGGEGVRIKGDGGIIKREGLSLGTIPFLAGRLEFDEVTLQEAIDEFARYGETGIVLEDEGAKRMRITGSFEIRRLDSFVRALPKIIPVRVRSEAGGGQSISSLGQR